MVHQLVQPGVSEEEIYQTPFPRSIIIYYTESWFLYIQCRRHGRQYSDSDSDEEIYQKPNTIPEINNHILRRIIVSVYLMPQPWQTGTTYIKYFELKEATIFADLQELASSQDLTGVCEKLEKCLQALEAMQKALFMLRICNISWERRKKKKTEVQKR
ncbi:hypothetical protein CDAR_282511 [Caerostris darwini]|uniref:Uncharacterized protein n=1 Tax=Caerostris darwini TaxID=1538125 RepID=A0AAV4MEN3_9ARAC|nr:hypothetical protein CDAR_282511 [Caerostris darwini]